MGRVQTMLKLSLVGRWEIEAPGPCDVGDDRICDLFLEIRLTACGDSSCTCHLHHYITSCQIDGYGQ